MFKTRGGVKGRLNNVKKTALLVKGGFPCVVNYLRHKRFSPTHQRESRTLKLISRTFWLQFPWLKICTWKNYKFEECIRTEEKQSCGQINQSLGQAAGFRTGHRPLSDTRCRIIWNCLARNVLLHRTVCLMSNLGKKQQEVLVYDEQGNLSKTTGSGYGRM